MSRPNFEPIPDDPAGPMVSEMFDANAEDWLLSTKGEYQTGAAQTWLKDGTGLQTVVVLEWPGRRNHTDEEVTVRLMIDPEDALGLADVLIHTVTWLIAAGIVRGTDE